MQLRSRSIRILAGAAVAAGGLAVSAQPASADFATVTNGGDSGPGSFRAAVEAANTDPDVDRIVFRGGIEVDLLSPVVFTGEQDLVIDGRNGSVSGASADPDTDTWDGGLFVADEGGGDLTLRRIGFVDSFNNGVAVFLPEGGDDVQVTLDRVVVTNSQFHGVLVDGQSTTGYNTDDVIHIACEDPYPVDSGSSIELDVSRTTITGVGRLEDYDISLLTGCPQDFDGLRVDQGGPGDITGTISRSTFDGNLADGVELDEKQGGHVEVEVSRTSFSTNGDTEPIECTEAYLVEIKKPLCIDDGDDSVGPGQFLADLDDGFDIDEEGDGDLVAQVSRLAVDGNNDEGLDFDEAGEGSIAVEVDRMSATGNNDEAFKASEEDGGDVNVAISRSVFTSSGNDGTEIEEEDDGDVEVVVERTTVTNSEGDGVKVVEDDDGDFELGVSRSTLTDNEDAGVLAEQGGNGSGSLTVDRSDLSGNGEPIDDDGVVVTVTRSVL